MDGKDASKQGGKTTVERTSDREFVVTRTFDAPARLVFDAWTQPELLKRWWVPRSMGMAMLSCEMDVRVGGSYRFVFDFNGQRMAVFGTYREVMPPSRLVWTNDEGAAGQAVTTVTFDERDGKTLLTFREVHPTKESLDEGIGMGDAMHETFAQLDELLLTAPSARSA